MYLPKNVDMLIMCMRVYVFKTLFRKHLYNRLIEVQITNNYESPPKGVINDTGLAGKV